MNIIVKANAEKFEEVKDGMCEALIELMKDEIENEANKKALIAEEITALVTASVTASVTESVTVSVTELVTARCEDPISFTLILKCSMGASVKMISQEFR